MKARLLFDRRIVLTEVEFAELVLWSLPTPVRGSSHVYKYRLAFVVRNVCVLRYDNEAGKDDHIHPVTGERPHCFLNPQQLVADFFEDARGSG